MTTGMWLIAGTPLDEPYPCMCKGSRACGRHCPRRGRTDNLDLMPRVCCARRAAETAARQVDYAWISAETEMKERDFRGLLGGLHVSIVKGIRERRGRPSDPPYLYVDLHGGPGNLPYGDRTFPGSPLIARQELAAAGMPFEAVHFESDPSVAGRLIAAMPPEARADVRAQSFEEGAERWLAERAPQPYRYGLVYSDPIKDPIPVETFNRFAAHFDRVDLLAYVAANDQYKRAGKRRLVDDIAAVKKKHVLIREATTAHQWTFILWTNWTTFPAWTKRGFHSATSERGRRIIEKLNYTAAELREIKNTPLFERPYATYREYLKHPRFLAIRKLVFERAAGTCEHCGQRPPTEPHHLRYPPWGEFDVPENLIAICHQCHCEIHGKAA